MIEVTINTIRPGEGPERIVADKIIGIRSFGGKMKGARRARKGIREVRTSTEKRERRSREEGIRISGARNGRE